MGPSTRPSTTIYCSSASPKAGTNESNAAQIQQIPNIEQSTPYHAYRRRKWAQARARVTIRRDLALQQKRKEMAEHPFGMVKWYDGAHYLLCRGKEKVTAEMALSFLRYNLRRVINIIGLPGILVQFCTK